MNFASTTLVGRRTWRLATIGTAAALVLSACGGSDSSTKSDSLDGEIFISGSSTVQPISVAVGEAFGEDTGVVPDVEGPGTGDGFKKFCAGETDISDASRTIKDEEAKACEDAGVNYVELEIAKDALTVVANPANSTVSCLTLDDLYGLVGPESEGVDNWKDAAAKGATSTLPDLPLEVIAPGTESGTYDSFWELAIKKKAEEKLGDAAEDQLLRPDYGGLANDNEILSGVEASDGALGWIGYAFASGDSDNVKLLEIDGGEGCVAPSPETVADGTYPLSRGLYIYVNTDKLADNAALGKFVDYYLSDDGLQAVTDTGYVALDDEAIAKTLETWDGVEAEAK